MTGDEIADAITEANKQMFREMAAAKEEYQAKCAVIQEKNTEEVARLVKIARAAGFPVSWKDGLSAENIPTQNLG